MLVLTLLLAGCGGGGQAPGDSRDATVILAVTGVTSGTLVGAVSLTLQLPPGVSVATNSDGTTGKGVLVASGTTLAAGVTPLVEGDGANSGELVVGVVSASGFQAGEFASVTLQVASGVAPAASSFMVTSCKVYDSLGNLVPAAGVLATVTLP